MHAADYALIYTANSRFDAPALLARFQANLLDLPVRRDEPALDRRRAERIPRPARGTRAGLSGF